MVLSIVKGDTNEYRLWLSLIRPPLHSINKINIKKFISHLPCSQFLLYLIILVLIYHFTGSVDFSALQKTLTIQLKLGMLNKAN